MFVLRIPGNESLQHLACPFCSQSVDRSTTGFRSNLYKPLNARRRQSELWISNRHTHCQDLRIREPSTRTLPPFPAPWTTTTRIDTLDHLGSIALIRFHWAGSWSFLAHSA